MATRLFRISTGGMHCWETTDFKVAMGFVKSFGEDAGFSLVGLPYNGREIPELEQSSINPSMFYDHETGKATSRRPGTQVSGK